MEPVLDGTASILVALAALLICGLPSWFSYTAIEANVAPTWAWGSILLLFVVGLIVTFAFVRRAFSGIAPTRERRHR